MQGVASLTSRGQLPVQPRPVGHAHAHAGLPVSSHGVLHTHLRALGLLEQNAPDWGGLGTKQRCFLTLAEAARPGVSVIRTPAPQRRAPRLAWLRPRGPASSQVSFGEKHTFRPEKAPPQKKASPRGRVRWPALCPRKRGRGLASPRGRLGAPLEQPALRVTHSQARYREEQAGGCLFETSAGWEQPLKINSRGF